MHLSARVTRSPRERRGERPVREGEREMRAERTRKGEGGERETRDAASEYRGHRKCSSGINKARSWIMVPT